MIRALILISFVLGGCSFFQKNEKPEPSQIELEVQRKKLLREFEKGNRYLDEKQYALAKETYNSILNKNPVTSLDIIILYNSGIAYEGLKNCRMAVNRYRRVVRASSGHKKLKAQALFRLSYAYICLGQNSKAIVNLIEVRKYRKYLPDEVAYAEVPARLAAAYARNGNSKMSKRFFKEAEHGIRRLQAKHRDPKLKKDTLAKTLFLMGNMKQLNPKYLDSKEYLASVRSLQGYLLQSIELESEGWSQRAKEQLQGAYDRVWDLLERAPQKAKSTDIISKREKIKIQIEVAQEALFSIEELKSLSFPDAKEKAIVKDLFSGIYRQEKRLKNFLAENNAGNFLTPEAQRREGLKRDGQTYRPDPGFDKKFKKPTELPPKKKR